MRVELLNSKEELQAAEDRAAQAMLTCRNNVGRLSKEPTRNFIQRAIDMQHDTILEHISLTYAVYEISRACLQELARHRHITLSVESTRSCLWSQMDNDFIEQKFNPGSTKHEAALKFLEFARAHPTMSNDKLKYYLPEFWPTNLIMTLNVRELRHIVRLRSAPVALEEFRNLATALCDALPDSFSYWWTDCLRTKLKPCIICKFNALTTIDHSLYCQNCGSTLIFPGHFSTSQIIDNYNKNWEKITQ